MEVEKSEEGANMTTRDLKIHENIKQKLVDFSIDELIELEEAILKVLKRKIKRKNAADWKKDFLKISEWTHLNDANQVKVDRWKIETF